MIEGSTLEIIQAEDGVRLSPGQGKIIHWRDSKGATPRPVLVLSCPDCGKTHWCSNHKIEWDKQENTITLEPSLICTGCQAHFLIKENKFIPA